VTIRHSPSVATTSEIGESERVKTTVSILLLFGVIGTTSTTSAPPHESATYVIVPGMWSGGWDWRAVDSILTARGHRVFRVTLTGLGERVHLATPAVGLRTHIEDVVNTILWEELSNVVLVGHSYGGMVISGVADVLPDRISRLVYVEAFVPESGESVESLAGPGFRTLVSQNTLDGMIRAPWVPEERPVPKEVPHPHRSFTDTLILANPAARLLPASYVLTIEGDSDPSKDGFALFAARASARGWPVHRMPGDHTPARSAPERLVLLLLL
jgi:pimeloyl-ACP methyl ester carboxylesterase